MGATVVAGVDASSLLELVTLAIVGGVLRDGRLVVGL